MRRDTRITLAIALNVEPWQLCKPEMTYNELVDTVEQMDIAFKRSHATEGNKRRGRRNGCG